MAPHHRQRKHEHLSCEAWEEIAPIIAQQQQPLRQEPQPQDQDILPNMLHLLTENGGSLYMGGDDYGITRRILIHAVLAIFERTGTPASRMAMLQRIQKFDILDLLLILSTKNSSRNMESIQDYIKLRKELARRMEPKQPTWSFFSPIQFKFVRRAWDYIALGRYHLSDLAMEDMPIDVKSIGVRILLLLTRTVDNMPDYEKLAWLCMSAFTILMANGVRVYGKYALFWKLLYGFDYPGFSSDPSIMNPVL